MDLDLPGIEAEADQLIRSGDGSHGEPDWLGPGWRARRGIASHLDATLLKPETSANRIVELCDRAAGMNAAAVCVNPVWVELATRLLRGKSPVVAAVVDFPLGAGTTAARRTEARLAVLAGARELDLVAPLATIQAGQWRELLADLQLIIATGRPARIKVILETAALSERQALLAAIVAREAGADWVKTSTGFHPAGGATIGAVRLLRKAAGDQMGVKASGGIRTLAEAAQMLAAGADRIGASAIEALETDRTLAELLG